MGGFFVPGSQGGTRYVVLASDRLVLGVSALGCAAFNQLAIARLVCGLRPKGVPFPSGRTFLIYGPPPEFSQNESLTTQHGVQHGEGGNGTVGVW